METRRSAYESPDAEVLVVWMDERFMQGVITSNQEGTELPNPEDEYNL